MKEIVTHLNRQYSVAHTNTHTVEEEKNSADKEGTKFRRRQIFRFADNAST